MIKYALKCDDGHGFESWFASAQAYDSLHGAGHVTCAVCGSPRIAKALMAPRVKTVRDADAPAEPPAEDTSAALAKLRANIEANATYVGGDFAKEARAQHLGDVPDRPIFGEAKPEEAKSLIEDGVPVAPLPFIPTRKAN
ncbi:DUF1178 family protein [uncultured Tateyamaria sp.]|uniref:DUF1178 family protein n=1 Tax=Tateyamaria sp. 1078 TaxID=3417464 RepID=UPI00262CB50D|nr:DUF1178 family protein [uncultured Tateyamaria sp.]